MSAAHGMLTATVSQGAAGETLASLAQAVRAAERAKNSVSARQTSVQPTPVDFTSLDIAGWKRYSVLSIFKGKDGTMRFTEARGV
eukprot:3781199-Pleurochrysis_carterae.AAC.1